MSDHGWTHPICWVCWVKMNPGRGPATLTNLGGGTCCFCGNETASGIYVRHDPKELKCGMSRPPKEAEDE